MTVAAARRPGPALEVQLFHSSGRWDRSPASLEANIERMRRGGRSLGTRTEIHPRGLASELHWPGDRWDHFHPEGFGGQLTNCSIEWSRDAWRQLDEDLVRLTDWRATTTKGYKLPPSELPWVLLESLDVPGLELELSAAHMNLHNTPARRRAWLEEAATIRRRNRASKRKHPDRVRVVQADVNRTQRLAGNRALVAREMAGGTDLRNLWVGHLPPRGGTHGRRAILDLALSSAPGHSYLLPDDDSSDHRPFGSTITIRL